MWVTRIELSGPATSFRYPHFLVGRQPTFDLPPPATLYGHVASALGDLPDPARLRIGYHFACRGRGDDLEHTWILTPHSVSLQPTLRELLFDIWMVLYIAYDGEDLTPYFRAPRYPVLLGRSQDLVSYRRVERVALQTSAQAYYQDTLLPHSLRERVRAGVAMVLPRYIDAATRRVRMDGYILLTGRARWVDDGTGGGQPLVHWVDPKLPTHAGLPRGVWLHTFVDQG